MSFRTALAVRNLQLREQEMQRRSSDMVPSRRPDHLFASGTPALRRLAGVGYVLAVTSSADKAWDRGFNQAFSQTLHNTCYRTLHARTHPKFTRITILEARLELTVF
jgi:hypothetical protein